MTLDDEGKVYKAEKEIKGLTLQRRYGKGRENKGFTKTLWQR